MSEMIMTSFFHLREIPARGMLDACHSGKIIKYINSGANGACWETFSTFNGLTEIEWSLNL